MSRTATTAQQVWIGRVKPVLFILCLLPAASLVYRGFTGTLGADPIEDLTFVTGDWTLRFLLITLTITPARYITGLHGLIRLRRMLGLFAFFYACLHFSVYLVLDQFFAWKFIVEDILERRYIMVGMLGLLSLIPLAVTSTDGMIRRLGGRRWRKLHRLAYVAGTCGVIHFLWLVKADLTEPLLYLIVLSMLLGYRVQRAARGRRQSSEARSVQAAGGDSAQAH